MTQVPASFPLGGGLDLVSPALSVAPGRLIAALNYEPLAEGYGRVAGYERCDGRALPSTIGFASMPYAAGTSPIEQGAIVIGSSSGASAYVLLDPYDPSGSWDAGTAAGTLVLAFLTGAFIPGETIRVGGIARATVAAIASKDSAPTEALRTAWTIAARERQRVLIGKVPGTGPVRGVAVLRGTILAWRDQNSTEGAMFRATAFGWAPVDASYTVRFSGGNKAVEEGGVFRQGAVRATAHRVTLQSGSYDTGDAAGYIVLRALTGSFAAGSFTADGTVNPVGSIVAQQTPCRFPAGGKYRTIGHNFFGATDRYALYGVNGVGTAFEFDGTFVSPILTGMVVDKPNTVSEMAQHLILTFPGGSIQFSGAGEPFVWNAQLGAGEIGLGDDVTDVLQASETAVVFFGRSKVATLTGRDIDTFQLDELSEEAGAMADTAQRLGSAVYLDEGGLRTLSATQAFGNFKTGTLTEVVSPLLQAKIATGAKPVASLICKRKGQYRVYWNDRTGLTVYTGRKAAESMPFSLGDMQPFCAATGELSDGTEGMFAGGEDGYVYRLDSGPSFDGDPVTGFAMLPYNHLGGVNTNKRFHAIALEMVAAPTTRIGLTCQFNYGDGTQPTDGSKDFTITGGGREFTVQGGGGVWDQVTWNDFFWSAPYSGTAEAPIDGLGRNISVLVATRSEPLEMPHILQAYHVFYSQRGQRRIG